MATFTQRVIGAARLNVATYEEVEADRTATGQAMGVVVLSAIAAGIGNLGHAGIGSLIAGAIGALIGWFLWAWLTWLIGTKVLPEPQTEADFGQLLRTIGFAASPGLLRVFGFIPVLGALVALVASIWSLIAMVVAVRQALDYHGTRRALAVCFIGFLVYLVLSFIPILIFGGGLSALGTR